MYSNLLHLLNVFLWALNHENNWKLFYLYYIILKMEVLNSGDRETSLRYHISKLGMQIINNLKDISLNLCLIIMKSEVFNKISCWNHQYHIHKCSFIISSIWKKHFDIWNCWRGFWAMWFWYRIGRLRMY